MPFVQHLIDAEGYELHRYRCGVPSTTPFAQAGILYGDNIEIPSFRWWNRGQGGAWKSGAGSTSRSVPTSYSKGRNRLTKDAPCIAACYPAGEAVDLGMA